MTSKTQKADEIRPLDDLELDLVSGGFTLIEMVVVIKEIAILIGMNLPPVHKVRDA